MIRFNQFILLTLIANFVSVISYFSYGLYISALINLSAAYFFILAFHLNQRRKFELARILSIVNLNLYLVMTFIISFKRNFRELTFVYVFTVISVAFCFKISPQENHYQVHILNMFTELYTRSLTISLLLTAFFS